MNRKLETLSDTVSSGIAQARDTTTDMLDSTSRAANQAVDRSKELASEAANKATEGVKLAKQRGSELADSATGLAAELHAMARQNPLTALIGAMFVGVLVGMMARGSRQ